MQSKLSRRLTFLLMFSLVGAQGCRTVQPLTLTVPPSLRANCDRPDPKDVATVSELAAFSIRQDGALTVCDRTRQALVELIDAQAKVQTPKRWWER